MAKNYMQWKTKGMNRDISASAFSAEFAFENVNLRLATNEGNTMMSWVNEKGTKEIEVTSIIQAWDNEEAPKIKEETTNDDGDTVEIEVVKLLGTTIGTAVINHQLVLFTTDEAASSTPDRIYVLSYSDEAQTKMTAKLVFQGNLNFKVEFPLETMVAFEASYVQKVYWTDNYNQPRLINIAASQEKCVKWNAHPEELSYYFDFVPSFTMKESDVTIKMNISAGGLFAPGVIQYVCTYINKYGQESNIAYISTLYYLTYLDRAASPEEKVTSSFSIKIENADTNFDYVRLYSIQRTSLDSVALVKKLDDFPITGKAITYTDNGMYGSTIDPTELLYVGGKEIKALTMTSKDNTMFLGNITQKNFLVKSIQALINDYRETRDEWLDGNTNGFMSAFRSDSKDLDFDTVSGVYSHTQTLKNNHREITTFKGGEVYRLGFQLQKKTGEWSEPIYLCDYKNDRYPETTITGNTVTLPTITVDDFYLDSIAEAYYDATGNDFFEMFTAIRPSIVYPTIGDRNVLCQGVLNPTVFNSGDRADNSPFAQPSWFFRPYCFTTNSYTNTVDDPQLTTAVAETKPSDADKQIEKSINPLFSYGKYYILVADIDLTTAASIVSKGYLNYKWRSGSYYESDPDHEEPSYSMAEQKYWGHILLSKNGNSNTARYAFIYSQPFQKEVSTSSKTYDSEKNDNLISVEDLKYTDLKTVYYDGTAFQVYAYLRITNNYYLYYRRDVTSELDENYTLMFYVGDTFYTVTFNNMKVDNGNVIEGTSGSNLVFTHYKPITPYSSIAPLVSGKDVYRMVEIEGGKSVYNTPYINQDTDKNYESKLAISNAEFFVDQSIVTLNSPDAEFDTEIQTYGFEGLHLRVLGIIPITGYRSAHSVSYLGNMMDAYHGEESGGKIYGTGEISDNVIHDNISSRAGKRLISDFLWNDIYVSVNADKSDGVSSSSDKCNFLIYPWQRTGSLNNDVRDKESATSYLETKKISHLLYSLNTVYFPNTKLKPLEIDNTHTILHLTENEEVYNSKIPSQFLGSSEINYYPNIDKVIYNSEGYKIYGYKYYQDVPDVMMYDTETSSPVSLKYKSTTHIAIALRPKDNDAAYKVPILPYAESLNPALSLTSWEQPGKFVDDYATQYNNYTFWGDTMQFTQDSYNLFDIFGEVGDNLDFLWLGELYKDVNSSNRFGGTTESALRANNWLIGGEAVPIEKSTDGSENVVSLIWTEGDTYYQRYDCLKTYPFTTEDINQNTEILSFMCETHVNLDGRYDKNRNQIKGYLMRPDNFNLMNSVYSQKNNFFTSSKVDTEDVDELEYPNYITYSKTKQSGADVDEWTNVTLASVLELDGDKGQVTSLNRLNDQLIAFQDKGISQVLYNESVQIASTEGVPIELANSGKVQGKRYLSDTIGCSNKWSIMQTPKGIYFMDSNDKSIYLFNGQLNNLSLNGGFNSWAKQNIPVADDEHKWNPVDYQNFKTIYDKINQDVMFINDSQTLAFSEKFDCFTSFYNYEKTPYFENLDNTGVWIKDGKLWKHRGGQYCNFFGENKPYSMTLVANSNPQMDKIFTNLEFRACVSGEGRWYINSGDFIPSLPFDFIEAWNEYQHGKLNLSDQRSSSSKAIMPHGTDTSILARKFRIWRCDIPRDNATPSSAEEIPLGIQRIKARPLDRIRNPWAYIKLFKSAAKEGDTLHKTEIHDIMATYFG